MSETSRHIEYGSVCFEKPREREYLSGTVAVVILFYSKVFQKGKAVAVSEYLLRPTCQVFSVSSDYSTVYKPSAADTFVVKDEMISSELL